MWKSTATWNVPKSDIARNSNQLTPSPGTVAPGFSPVNPAQQSRGFSPRGKGEDLAGLEKH